MSDQNEKPDTKLRSTVDTELDHLVQIDDSELPQSVRDRMRETTPRGDDESACS